MDKEFILGKYIDDWLCEYPLLRRMIKTEEIFWINPKLTNFDEASNNLSLSENDVLEASMRLNRFAPYISKVFPETKKLKELLNPLWLRYQI